MKGKELDKVLADLVEISKRYGRNPEYVLGEGGSAAQKDCGVMYIKDADIPLGDLGVYDFISLDRNKLNDVFDRAYPNDGEKRDALIKKGVDAAKLFRNDYRRAGINALIHNLLNFKYTLHVHPALLNGLACVDCKPDEARRLIGDDMIWVGGVSEGYDTAMRAKKLISDYLYKTGRAPQLMVIQNHGVFLAGDTPTEIDRQMLKIMSAVEAHINGAPDAEPLAHDAFHIGQLMKNIAQCYHDKPYAEFTANKRILKFIANETGKREICPPNGRESCCAKPMHMVLEDPKTLKETFKSFVKINRILPRIICIPNVGAVAVGSTKEECRQALSIFMNRISASGYNENYDGFLHMTDKLINHILNYGIPGYGKGYRYNLFK